MRELYNENFRTLQKKIEEDTRRKTFMLMVLNNSVKMAILPKANSRVNGLCIKITMPFFTEIDKKNLKFILKHQRPYIANAILSKRNNSRNIIIYDFVKLHSSTNKNCML